MDLHNLDFMETLLRISDELEENTIAVRRKIHQNPELSFEEIQTGRLVEEELKRLGIPFEKSPAEPGIVAEIDSKRPGKLLMLRADMDALPIEETADIPFRSKNPGVMHACGHDVHTANLLAVGTILDRMRPYWSGRVKLVFQPAEERGGGGRQMIEHGLMDEMPDACMALHVTSDRRGMLSIGTGPVTSFSDRCGMVVHGRAAHSSEPQEGVDAVYIAASIIVSLNTVISKQVSPMQHSTLNMGMISGGGALNVITDRVEMAGMMRNADPASRKMLMEKIRSLSEGIASAMGGSCEVWFEEGYSSVYNDEALTRFVIDTIEENEKFLIRGIGGGSTEDSKENTGNNETNGIRDNRDNQNNRNNRDMADMATTPSLQLEIAKGNLLHLASEDFGFYSQKAPSCYMMIGTGEGAPVHNPEFKVDESCIKLATRTLALAAMKYLQPNTP